MSLRDLVIKGVRLVGGMVRAADAESITHLAFGMSNLQPEDTGIKGIVVFVSTGEVEGKKMPHGPRVKVALGRTTNIVATMSIGTPPVLTGGKLAVRYEQEVKEFIAINYNTLMAYWNMEISTRQMVMAIVPIK